MTEVLFWIYKNASTAFRPHCAGGISKRYNHRSFWIDLCLRKPRSGKSHDYHIVTPFSRWSLFKIIYVQLNNSEKLAFSNSSGLKSVFKKFLFRDGLVWTVGLTAEIRLRFNSDPSGVIMDAARLSGTSGNIFCVKVTLVSRHAQQTRVKILKIYFSHSSQIKSCQIPNFQGHSHMEILNV